VIAASDFIRAYPDLIRNWVPGRYTVLGTDGLGRSDTRVALRDFFEIDARYIALAALTSLADLVEIPRETLASAIVRLGIDTDKPSPLN
jgi:pyruvate dehydrogenase E1 component